MSTIRKTMSREEVAALVCSTLERHGIRTVLSGGSVVSIYSENAYESYDLDFIEIGLGRSTVKAMSELGFKRNGRHWVHSETPFWVEFPTGPVQIGKTHVTSFAERTTRFGVLRLLHPTDCVMDRLAAYFHWNDTESLEQAILVARSQPIDLDRIATWSKAEGELEKFREFSRRSAEAVAKTVLAYGTDNKKCDSTTTQENTAMRTGELKGGDAEHPASGRIIVTDGKIKLENVTITEAPDGRVILAKNFDESSSVRCGSVKSYTGSHEYDIPAGTNVDEYDTVVIWCDKFSVPIGLAKLSA